MSNERDDDTPRRPLGTPINEERPLDTFFPELSQPDAPNDPAQLGRRDDAEQPIVDPMVSEVELEAWQEWALACWRAPENDADGRALLKELTPIIEATILQEMSRPPGWGGATDRRMKAIHLFVFDRLHDAQRDALGRMGFERVDFDPEVYANRLKVWQNEATRAGWEVPTAPTSLWLARLDRGSPEMAEKLREVHEALAVRLGADIWGAKPGTPSHEMASLLERHFSVSIQPDDAGLHTLDMLMVDRATHTIRWVEPMLFQGICDFVGVVWSARDKQVRWGACESDNRGGHYPPLLRVGASGGPRDIAVGLALLRAAVMPIQSEDQAPRLEQWAAALL